MATHWYALRSKPRKEDALSRQVNSQGFEVFYPQLRVNPVNPRSRKWRPYFPGYLFIHVDLEQAGLSVFQWMPYSLGLVSFGDIPSDVPDHLIEAIRRRVDHVARAGGEILDGLKQGDVVSVRDGPFAGYEAIFDIKLPGNERVRVLLEMLGNQRKVAVELAAGQIRRKK